MQKSSPIPVQTAPDDPASENESSATETHSEIAANEQLPALSPVGAVRPIETDSDDSFDPFAEPDLIDLELIGSRVTPDVAVPDENAGSTEEPEQEQDSDCTGNRYMQRDPSCKRRGNISQ